MSNLIRYSSGLILCSCLLLGTTAVAAPPDAGQLLREQQPQRQLPAQLPQPEVENVRQPLADSGVRVTVKGFTFTGYEGVVAERTLQELVAGAVGTSLTFGDLQSLVEKINAYLKGKGWFLARAYLPKQDVTSGMIEIAIIQGKSDTSLTITRSSTTRIHDETVRAIAQRAIRPGQALNEQCLERAIILMNDLPGISARASLSPGTTPGSTSIQLDVTEGPLLSGVIWGDNQGNRYTGSGRGNGMVNVNDPFRYGDQLSLLLNGSEGLIQGRAAYSFPLSPGGLRANLAYTGMHYELIGDLAYLDSEGQSHIVNIGISYPLLRSRTVNVVTTLGYEYKHLTDSAAAIDIRDKQLSSGTISLNGDSYDAFGGGGTIGWNAGVTSGNLHESIADIGITRTQGTYSRINLGLARLQRLAERLALNLSWSAQLSLDNLDSSEKFILGGPNGVRAYPVGEAPGDEGHLLNIDLRYDLPLPVVNMGLLQLTGFYDAGKITLHKHPWINAINSATDKNSYWLQGGGMGLAYTYGGRFSLRGSWAHVIGDNPGRSTGNMNADGGSDENRFWLQGTLIF